MTQQGCRLCPRRCGAVRTRAGGNGRCGMGSEAVVARAALHFGEEPCISGTWGSGTVFFCGCALGCVFCQNAEISCGAEMGMPASPARLGGIFANLAGQGAHNINLITGGHFLPAIVRALRDHPPGIPVVYNTSGYESVPAIRALEGLVDVYLPDFKYADSRTAAFCADAPDYPVVAMDAIAEMLRQTGPAVHDDQGMLVRGTLVRHLVLPGLTGASMRALTMLKDAFGDAIAVSLMGQYTPYGRALSIPGLDRPLRAREYGRVVAHMQALKLDGYIQALDAAGTRMIPAWDLTGIGPAKETIC